MVTLCFWIIKLGAPHEWRKVFPSPDDHAPSGEQNDDVLCLFVCHVSTSYNFITTAGDVYLVDSAQVPWVQAKYTIDSTQVPRVHVQVHWGNSRICVSPFVIIQFFPWRMTDDKAGQVQYELSAGGTKRDVENTQKCTRLNCILARWSSLGPPPVGRHRL